MLYTSLLVRPAGRTATTRHYRVYVHSPQTGDADHRVTLTWDGSTDRPNSIACDCGKRSCVPLRLVRDLEKHDGLPRVA